MEEKTEVKEVNEVIYFVNYIVLDEGNPEINQGILHAKEIVDLAKPKSDGRKKIQKILKIIAGLIEDKKSLDYEKAIHYYEYLNNSNMPFSIQDVFNLITKYTDIKFGIGAEAIQTLLKKIDLDKEMVQIEQKLRSTDTNSTEAKKILRRLECFKWFKSSGNKPE